MPAIATVGVLGCSNTQDATTGYHRVSTQQTLWSHRDLQGYGGKCVVDWANPASPTWRNFSKGLTIYPATNRIWWQMCTHINEGTAQSHADAALAILRTYTPLPLVVSPLDLSASCHRSDDALAASMVDLLIERGDATAGPILSALEPHQMRDACHANEDGVLIWGAELAAFFDS